MVKRMLIISFFVLLMACSQEEPVILKKETNTTDEYHPALIEEEQEDENDTLIEFTFPEEQIMINLKNIPILNEYLQATNDKEKAIRNMEIIQIEKYDIFILELSIAIKNLFYFLLHTN